MIKKTDEKKRNKSKHRRYFYLLPNYWLIKQKKSSNVHISVVLAILMGISFI
jgi:hypothetical protein